MQGIRIILNYVGAQFDIALLNVTGYVDTTTCQELAQYLEKLIEKKHFHIIINLEGVSYISSAGWGVFMGEIKNVRDKGGDIKIVQLPAEVFEVFQMLEFNRILNHYDTVEEAIDEFDVIRGIDLTFIDREAMQLRQSMMPTASEGIPASSIIMDGDNHPGSAGQKLSVRDFPLTEKIKMIVLDNPLLNIFQIKNQLGTPKYGEVKIGFFKLRAVLKELSLDTKEKRYRFYRSR